MARTYLADTAVKKPRGRPPGSRASGASSSRLARSDALASNSKKRKKGNTSQQDDEDDELSGPAQTQTRPSKTRKRKAPAEPDNIAEEPTKAHKKYVQLESKTKRIPQEVIETWPTLPQPLLEQISAVIKDAKKDIANTQRDERKIMAAHNSLNPLVKRLVHHLSASKIPPQARDIYFTIDKLTERNGQVFRDVTTARHSKQLLDEQVKVAQTLLAIDERNLDEMKKDAKKWKAEWKRQQKPGRIHPFLRDTDHTGTDLDGPDDICLRPAPIVREADALDASDPELVSVLDQLRRSLENMQANHGQVEGIDEAMSDAHTALDDVLFRRASAAQYSLL